MNEPEPASELDPPLLRLVFVSYATADRKDALAVCKAIENRGATCWISTRDVAPGENYQEAIVRSIRHARAVALIFSKAANNSDEIKKELSLASRYGVPVIALRIEDVEPSDAFAYELSTRQWIDAFEGWDRSIDSLVSRIGQLPGAPSAATQDASIAGRRRTFSLRRPITATALAGVLLLVVAAGVWWLGSQPPAAQSMTVRLAGFQLLSSDLPATTREAIDSEIAAAFNADGVVDISTAGAPSAGSSPAYALGGTIQRVGGAIRVITRLTNERSGATLWSHNANYDGAEAPKIPRHIAVDAGNVVRCGLFGASTYKRPLPDSVLGDYLQFCQGHWDPRLDDGRKALVPAQRVVAAAPDFSWGWAAVAAGYWKVAISADNPQVAKQARASGRQAADRAIAIDPGNSEALWIKSLLLDRNDWAAREDLLKRAVAAQRLDCGCEHHQYGELLGDVGRVADAVTQLRQANDMLALYMYTPLSLADALVAAGKADDAKPQFDAAIELAPDPETAAWISLTKALATGDTGPLLDPSISMPLEQRAAMLDGYRAVAKRNVGAKARAVQALLALPQEQQNNAVARLLGNLGADHQAFELAARLVKGSSGPALFWYPEMRGTLNDPGFPALAAQLGLLKYWQTTRIKPDACIVKASPLFCRAI